MRPDDLPHSRVMTRLRVSRIHGIGVFAIVPIPAGANPFESDQREDRWVDAEQIDALSGSPQWQLYHDFGIRRGSKIGCPESFDVLGSGWYVNEPRPGDEPNLVCSPQLEFAAARDIAPGEELTIRYSTFSETVASSS